MKGKKGQLFTLDLLLALIPLTLVLGYSASAMSGAITQIQDYAYRYSMHRVASDAVDAIVKSPGVPPNWNSSNPPTLLGMAEYDTSTNLTTINTIDDMKLVAMNSSYITQLIGDDYSYYNLSMQGLENTSFFMNWSSGERENASNIVSVERIALLEIIKQSGAIFQITHLGNAASDACNDPSPGEPRVYELSFYVTSGELGLYEFWLVVLKETTGIPVRYDIFSTQQDCDTVSLGESIDQNEVESKEEITSKLTGDSQNYLYLRVTGNPALWVDAYVLRVPPGTSQDGIDPDLAGPKATIVRLEVGR